MRRLAIALALFVLATAAGCGEKSESQRGDSEPLTLMLDFYVNPDHAGIYTALERGYFDEAGLEVAPVVPSDPSAPIRQVAAGRADIAISYEPEILLAQEEGLPVTAIAALVPRPLTSLISLPEAEIASPADLRGKTIATAGIPYQAAYLEAILEEAGLGIDDVTQKDVGFNLLPAVLSGSADAMLGGFLNVEGVALQQQGRDPTVRPVNKLGIPTYNELVLVANSDTLDSESQNIRLFLDALQRGTEAAVADPAGATKDILEAGKGLDPKTTRAEMNKTLPLLAQKGAKHYGYMDPNQWKKFAQFFADNGEIKALPPTDDVLTNDLLPGTQQP